MSSVSINSVSHLSLVTSSISRLLNDQFGPYGKSVLFERSGSVFTTKDGSEILSVIAIEDPVAATLIKDILSFGKQHQDGVKLFAILAAELFANCESASSSGYANDFQRRGKMVEYLDVIGTRVLPRIFDSIFENCKSVEIGDQISTTVTKVFLSFLNTRFSSNVSKFLSTLLTTFLTENLTNDFYSTLESLVRNPSNYFIEIPGMAIQESRIMKGFILTRNFKYLKDSLSLQNCSFVLWSIELAEKEDQMPGGVVEVDSAASLTNVYFHKSTSLSKIIETLRAKSVSLIVSSVYFPEWAVAICMRFGISVIDMVDAREFDVIKVLLHIHELTSFQEVRDLNSFPTSSFDLFCIGNKKYVKAHLEMKQIILCGPTLSQTKQYLNACHKAVKYLHQWIIDSNSGKETATLISTNNSSSRTTSQSLALSQSKKLYYVHCRGHIYFMIYKCIDETVFPKPLAVEKRILKQTVRIPIRILHKQMSFSTEGSFLQYWHTLESSKETYSAFPHEYIENPFVAFRILTQITASLIRLLRIEHIIKTSIRLKKDRPFRNENDSESDHDSESDDDSE